MKHCFTCRCVHTKTIDGSESADGSDTVTVTVVFPDGSEKKVSAKIGWTLMESLRDADVHEIEAICGGSLSCSTCHIIVEQSWFDKLLSDVSSDEADLLDITTSVEGCSRLSCQIDITRALDGLIVRIPVDH